MTNNAQTGGTVVAGVLVADVVSFAYGRGADPQAHVTIDTRFHFGTVHGDTQLAPLTAAATEVREAVMTQPGARELIERTVALAEVFGLGEQGGPIRIAIGGVDGKHTSAAIAAGVARFLEGKGAKVTLTHREMEGGGHE